MSIKSRAALGLVFSIKNKKYSKNPGLVTIRLDLCVGRSSSFVFCLSERKGLDAPVVVRKGLNLLNASVLNIRWLVSGQTSGQSRCRSV